MMTGRNDAHVTAWVKHHARQLSRKALAAGFKPQALHEYLDTDNSPTHWRIRLKNPNTGDKWIRPLMRVGAGFELKQPDYPNGTPLYRLHELIAREHEPEPVLIVEGEFCADALAKLDILATTSGAADSAGKADWSILTGGIVTVWPDNDEAGQRYAQAVKTALESIGCTVAVIDVPALDMPHKGDCVDWLVAHPNATAADIHVLPKIDHGESTTSDDQGTGKAKPQPDTNTAAAPILEWQDWPDPLPVPSMLLPVESFNVNLLPLAIRAWVADITERMQCPPDFPAVGAMVALSSVIGRKACIAPKRHDDWRVIPNLWGAVVGRPGVMKSPALSEVMRPLDRMAVAAGEEFDKAQAVARVAEKLAALEDKADEAKAAKLVKEGKTEAAARLLTEAAESDSVPSPALRRYKVTDASVEALGEILIENPFGTLAYRDELNGLLRSLDKEGQEGARAFYLQGYDGNQGYTFDRIMRGRNLHIPAVCIAMLGGIQPGKLETYIRDAVSGGAGDDGLLQRFGLLVWPDVTSEWRNVDRFPDTPAKAEAFAVFLRLDAMEPATDTETGEPCPAVYRFTADAQTTFEEWRSAFEPRIRGDEYHPAMQSHLAKYRKLVPAVALVCALIDNEPEVSRASLLRALAWAEYLQSHAERAYAAGTAPATEGATALLAKIRGGKVADGFALREVYRQGWVHLGSPEAARAAALFLCDLGHLRANDAPVGWAGGRPSETYAINPKTAEVN